MEKYNYLEAIVEDVKEYIEENVNLEEWEDLDELEDELNDTLFCEDSVTGNGSGSYTFSRWEAEENLCHNLDLLSDAIDEFGGENSKLLANPETADVLIRCYLLGQAISQVIAELK